MEKFKKVIEDSAVTFDKEDGGQALICYFGDYDDTDSGMFVRLQSWDERNKNGHPEADRLKGKRVRITIEEL